MMELQKIVTEAEGHIEGLYIVQKISPEDISPPSGHFLKFVRELKGFPFLNTFTIVEFTKQVRHHFAYLEH